ncbi:MAG: histone deacetylase family protein [Alphaproteobacteria bacterium]
MTTRLYSHGACLDHDTGPGHPERPDRLRAVLTALETEPFQDLVRLEAPHASREQLLRVHPAAHVDRVLAALPSEGFARVDPDTVVSAGSGEAALRAAGAVCAAVDAVLAGEARNAFCAVRPPGHHAEPNRAMGFCLFNSVAVGALHARAAHGVTRIAVIDFDVHHGNGTQAAFQADPDLVYVSSHQSPLYPGTGAASETGVGNIHNAPLPPFAGSKQFRDAYERELLPVLRSFAPELVLISAGFDAHADDPLANMMLSDADYGWITAELCKLANETCGGKVVSTLEGGYDLAALGRASAAHVSALLTH